MVEQGAREFFCEVRRACARLEDIAFLLDAGYQRPSGSGSGAPGYRADPIGDLVAQADMWECSMVDERDALEERVGEALEVIAGVYEVFGQRYGTVLELYYVDYRNSWADVARIMGVPETTVRRWAQVALDKVDNHGLYRTKARVPWEP